MSADGRFALVGKKDGSVAHCDLSLGREVTTFEGHSGPVQAMAVTPDGRFGISGGNDRSVRLWAVESGQCLAILRGHEGIVMSVAVSADGRRIASVAWDRTLRVWDIPDEILEGAGTARKQGYVNAKVVLVGDSGVGKSGLALRLWQEAWKATGSSHGMEVRRLKLGGMPDKPSITREVWLWDLAGQPHYRLTHQLFMEQTALALLVFDPEDDRLFETVGYWQNALRKVTGKDTLPGILVAGRCDVSTLRLTKDEVHDWAEKRGLHGPVETAAKIQEHPGVAELCALIEQLLPWHELPVRTTMANFPALKDAVLAVREGTGTGGAQGGVVVRPEELEARVRRARPELTFTPEDLGAVTGLLAGEGVLYRLPYGGLVVLQPHWVNSYASILVRLAGAAPAGLGVLPLALMQPGKLPADGTERLTEEDERQLLPALESLFLERALAWKQETEGGAMLVFPSHVRRPREDGPPRGHTVRYRFTGPLEQIYCTLVVRLHYSGLVQNEDTRLYRQAVDFHTATGKLAALTMEEEGEWGELKIHFAKDLDMDVQAPFERFVREHLEAKAAGSLERLRNYLCPKCGKEARDREAIDWALQQKRKTMNCAYCDRGKIVMDDALEQQVRSKQAKKSAAQASQHANEGIATAFQEGTMVGEVQTIVFNAHQIYRTVAGPDVGVDGDIQFCDEHNTPLWLHYRVQLKSGNSHLRGKKQEVFAMKPHYEALWAAPGAVPLLLIIRTEDKLTREKRLRFIDATEAIHAAQRANPGQPVKQIVFTGEDFTEEAVLRLREKRRAECAAAAATAAGGR